MGGRFSKSANGPVFKERRHTPASSDRVATYQARPQRYGTQCLCIGDTSRLYPLSRPAKVNLYRVEIKLDPLSDTDIESAYTSYSEITTTTTTVAGGSS